MSIVMACGHRKYSCWTLEGSRHSQEHDERGLSALRCCRILFGAPAVQDLT